MKENIITEKELYDCVLQNQSEFFNATKIVKKLSNLLISRGLQVIENKTVVEKELDELFNEWGFALIDDSLKSFLGFLESKGLDVERKLWHARKIGV